LLWLGDKALLGSAPGKAIGRHLRGMKDIRTMPYSLVNRDAWSDHPLAIQANWEKTEALLEQ